MDDPGSLQNLNDIVTPGAIAWWPPAPGWYAVLAVLVVLLAWGAFRSLVWWRRNIYRRQALRELQAIRAEGASSAARIPPLLKRVALSAWPRPSVAHLSGREWHGFLDRTAAMDRFSDGGTGALLDSVSYVPNPGSALPGEVFERVCKAAEFWIRNHRVEAGAP